MISLDSTLFLSFAGGEDEDAVVEEGVEEVEAAARKLLLPTISLMESLSHAAKMMCS